MGKKIKTKDNKSQPNVFVFFNNQPKQEVKQTVEVKQKENSCFDGLRAAFNCAKKPTP